MRIPLPMRFHCHFLRFAFVGGVSANACHSEVHEMSLKRRKQATIHLQILRIDCGLLGLCGLQTIQLE